MTSKQDQAQGSSLDMTTVTEVYLDSTSPAEE
jgi:hypothetical protein